MARLVVALLALSLFAGPALAHKLKVFARVEGGEIRGTAYFVGGAPASGVEVRVIGPDGSVIARPVPDAEGRFSHRPSGPDDYLVEVDSGDGHVARWKLAAGEFAAAAVSAGPTAAADAPATGSGGTEAAPPAPEADADLAALIEAAVARQVGPLRDQVQAYQDEVRLHDVLGGIGYILGLAGLALWWRNRGGGR